MSTSNFHKMTSAEFEAFQPRDADEGDACEKETEFRQWCMEHEEDPQDSDARDRYKEEQAEQGAAGWEGMDENDLAGGEDNMNKD